jgi:hypothetical protein
MLDAFVLRLFIVTYSIKFRICLGRKLRTAYLGRGTEHVSLISPTTAFEEAEFRAPCTASKCLS